MAIRDLCSERVFVQGDLAANAALRLEDDAAHYLSGVLRMTRGGRVLVFNGTQGEWITEIAEVGKRYVSLRVLEQSRSQENGPDIDYVFAPLKRTRLDYMVQKATELGVRSLRPVITERTVAERVKLDRMKANVVEAAEQCGVLRIPNVQEPQKLPAVLRDWDPARRLIFCDEAQQGDPLKALLQVPDGPLAVLVGPEGGFSEQEREMLLAREFVIPISLGPRIMRGDTAAVAALALVNATVGDWRQSD